MENSSIYRLSPPIKSATFIRFQTHLSRVKKENSSENSIKSFLFFIYKKFSKVVFLSSKWNEKLAKRQTYYKNETRKLVSFLMEQHYRKYDRKLQNFFKDEYSWKLNFLNFFEKMRDRSLSSSHSVSLTRFSTLSLFFVISFLLFLLLSPIVIFSFSFFIVSHLYSSLSLFHFIIFFFHCNKFHIENSWHLPWNAFSLSLLNPLFSCFIFLTTN